MGQDESAKTSESARYQQDDFKGLIRKNGQGWPADKYGRMGLYVFLYNRIKGLPTKWGLEDEDVSFRIKDVIEKRFDEVYQEYIGKYEPIKGLNISKEPDRSLFLSEINQYNEHAQKIATPMPTTQRMSQFLQAVADDKNDYYMTIHKSVQEKSGEYMDEKKQKTSLIYERYKKQREIDKQKYDLRRDNFWTGLKGAGAAGSGGLTVGAGVALFLLPIPVNIVAGLAGGALGFAGLRNFGLSFVQAVAKNIKMRQRLRDLYNKGGAKGDRGLKEIEKAIQYNRDLKAIMDAVGKKMVGKDGKVPTQAEFEDFIKKNYPKTYKMLTNGDYMGNMKKFYEDSLNHYQTQEGGTMRAVMGFMERHAVTVVNNSQLAIEREDLLRSRFNVEGKKVKLGEKGHPIKGSDGKYIYEDETQTMKDWIETFNIFKIDAETYKKQMPREYQEIKQMASRSLYNVFRNSIFDGKYDGNSSQLYRSHYNNEEYQQYLRDNPDGDKTQIIRNAVVFLENEARLDSYETMDHSLRGELGVSVKEQLIKDENFGTVAGNACKRLLDEDGVTDPTEISKTQNVVNRIQAVLQRSDITKAMFDSILVDIDTLPISAQNYLRRMVEVKRDEAKLTSSDIDNSLRELAAGTDISAVLNDPKITAIKTSITSFSGGDQNYSNIMASLREFTIVRNKSTNEIEVVSRIYDTSLYEELPEYKTKIVDSLNEQIRAAEAKQRNRIRANVLDDIQNGRLNRTEDLQQYFDEFINKITFEQLTTKFDEIRAFYNTKVIKANTPALREYLDMRLRNKMELEYINRVKGNLSVYAVEGGMEKLKKDVILIKNNPYLTDEQKRRIIAEFAPHIELHLAVTVKTMQKELFNNGQYQQDLEVLLNNRLIQGGFSEFLKEDSDYDINGKLKLYGDRLRAYQMVLSNKNNFVSTFGEATSNDPGSPETKLILRLLLTESGRIESVNEMGRIDNATTNKLLSEIREMKTFISGTFSSDTDSYISDKNKAINAVQTNLVNHIADDAKCDITLDNINDIIARNDEHKDVLLAKIRAEFKGEYVKLLALKNQAVTALKGQVRQLLKGEGAQNPTQYLEGKKGSKYMNQLRERWSEVFSDIDIRIEKCEQILSATGFNLGGIAVTRASDILTKLTGSTTAYQSAIGNTATFDGLEKGA